MKTYRKSNFIKIALLMFYAVSALAGGLTPTASPPTPAKAQNQSSWSFLSKLTLAAGIVGIAYPAATYAYNRYNIHSISKSWQPRLHRPTLGLWQPPTDTEQSVKTDGDRDETAPLQNNYALYTQAIKAMQNGKFDHQNASLRTKAQNRESDAIQLTLGKDTFNMLTDDINKVEEDMHALRAWWTSDWPWMSKPIVYQPVSSNFPWYYPNYERAYNVHKDLETRKADLNKLRDSLATYTGLKGYYTKIDGDIYRRFKPN